MENPGLAAVPFNQYFLEHGAYAVHPAWLSVYFSFTGNSDCCDVPLFHLIFHFKTINPTLKVGSMPAILLMSHPHPIE